MPEAEKLHQIMYTSTAAERMEVGDLSDLLTQARDKNDRLSVTGMLIYRRKSFMQIIEGGHGTLMDLYDTIQADERHRNVITLLNDETDERDFEGWSMAFRHLGELTTEDMPEGFSDFFSSNFETSDFQGGSYGKKMMLHFRDASEF